MWVWFGKQDSTGTAEVKSTIVDHIIPRSPVYLIIWIARADQHMNVCSYVHSQLPLRILSLPLYDIKETPDIWTVVHTFIPSVLFVFCKIYPVVFHLSICYSLYLFVTELLLTYVVPCAIVRIVGRCCTLCKPITKWKKSCNRFVVDICCTLCYSVQRRKTVYPVPTAK